MPNNLTGDYDAVVQVSIQQINGLLATLHQNGAAKDVSPSFLHSMEKLSIGDPPLIFAESLVELNKWFGGTLQDLRVAGAPDVTPLELADKAPPGAAMMIRGYVEDLATARHEVIAPDAVRGVAQLQLSAPTISLAPGSSEASVELWVRAHYSPDPGSQAMPKPIHGEITIGYDVTSQLVNGKRMLDVRVSPQDSRIQFKPAPGSGLTAAQDATLTAQIRRTLREKFEPTAVGVDNAFPFTEFVGVGMQPNSTNALALALPFHASGTGSPGAIASVTNPFIGLSEFAIALAREFIENAQLKPFTDSLKGSAVTFKVSLLTVLEAEYTLTVAIDPLKWNAGSLEFSGVVKLETDSALPNGTITFRQAVTVELDAPSQSFGLKPLNDPWVDESWWIPHAKAVSSVKSARDAALPLAQAALNQSLAATRAQFTSALKSFDGSASLDYTGIEITPDGIIVRGAIKTKGRSVPVVTVGQSDGAFSALHSWIPGGRIHRHIWSWVEDKVFTTSSGQAFVIPWAGKVQTATQEHEFLLPVPAVLQGRPHWSSGICLRIEGEQTSADGQYSELAAGEYCSLRAHEPIIVVSPLEEAIYGIHWIPDPAPDDTLEDFIAAHVDVQGQEVSARDLTSNTLVYFTGREPRRPLEMLHRALRAVRRETYVLSVVLVLPVGFFRNSRRDAEELLGVAGEGLPVKLTLTEDYEGSWARLFGAGEGPAIFLMNALRHFVWRQEGRVRPEEIAAALDRHLISAPLPAARPVRLAIEPGDRAPDLLFETDEGQELAMRRLRGVPVLLCFWQSWSAPCIRELRRLQAEQHGDGRRDRGPVVVAVNGGEGREVSVDVRRRHQLTFTLAHDRGRRIARQYGISCWPTIVSVDADGIVDGVRLGASHVHRGEHDSERTEEVR
jgi:peroxiredoxin